MMMDAPGMEGTLPTKSGNQWEDWGRAMHCAIAPPKSGNQWEDWGRAMYYAIVTHQEETTLLMEISRITRPLLSNKWTRIPAAIILWPVILPWAIWSVLNQGDAKCACGKGVLEHNSNEYRYIRGKLVFDRCQTLRSPY